MLEHLHQMLKIDAELWMHGVAGIVELKIIARQSLQIHRCSRGLLHAIASVMRRSGNIGTQQLLDAGNCTFIQMQMQSSTMPRLKLLPMLR